MVSVGSDVRELQSYPRQLGIMRTGCRHRAWLIGRRLESWNTVSKYRPRDDQEPAQQREHQQPRAQCDHSR